MFESSTFALDSQIHSKMEHSIVPYLRFSLALYLTFFVVLRAISTQLEVDRDGLMR